MSDSERVVIIDDQPTNLKLLAAVLAAEGFEVLTATDAASGLELIEQQRPDIVLTDIQLPDMDGLEMTRQLKRAAATSEMIVIAVTAYAMATDERDALAAGCDGFITKPIDTRTLGSTIAGYVAAARAHDRL